MVPTSLRRRVAAPALILIAAALVAVIDASPARAATFTNNSPITIPASGIAAPYPSTIAVAGLGGSITDVNVTLTGISHTYPDDIDVILVGPAGQRVRLFTDVGTNLDINSVNLTLDDAAVGFLPDAAQIVSGTFRPTFGASGGDFTGPAPAPGPPYSSTLAAFNGTAPTGTWSLFVFDDAAPDSGSIAGGWTLNILTDAPTVTSFNPTSGTPGTVVVITGTNFSGTTAVRFGGVLATVFTENSPTQITATVPAGAITGPISVTTPLGTGVSTTNFTVNALVPTISSFSPLKGFVGTNVTITGTNLTDVSAVTFDGTGGTFTVNSSTQITATVPGGASTGPIQVVAPGGTATSATDFVVQHRRSITLDVSSRKAKGKVTVDDGFKACASSVEVRVLFDDGPGGFQQLGTDTTDSTGRYVVGGATDPGRYRAIATAVNKSGDVCNKRSVTETK